MNEKESAAIRRQMNEIRCRLPYHMDQARSDVRQTLDWKHHVRQHPLVAGAIVAGLAYAMVPKRQPPPPPDLGRWHRLLGGKSNREAEEDVKKKTVMSGLLSAAVTLAARGAFTFATRQLTGRVTDSLQRSFTSRSSNGSGFNSPSSKQKVYR